LWIPPVDHPALAAERLMAVPGIVAALESEERAGDRRHFGDDIVEIGGEPFEARVLAVTKMGPANVLVPVICHTQWAVSSDAACSV
jgi:hypothetical protein